MTKPKPKSKPSLHTRVQTTDPRRTIRIKSGVRAGDRLWDSQNQHYPRVRGAHPEQSEVGDGEFDI